MWESFCNWMAGDSFYGLFERDMRPGMFTGFLTISGFLVSAHTFIIIHMKKEMYESATYKVRVADARKTNPKHSYYGPLKRLSRLLMLAVVTSLCTSLFQVTFGLHHANWSAVLCVGMATLAFLMLVASVTAMALNLRCWFHELEDAEHSRPTVTATPNSPV